MRAGQERYRDTWANNNAGHDHAWNNPHRTRRWRRNVSKTTNRNVRRHSWHRTRRWEWNTVQSTYCHPIYADFHPKPHSSARVLGNKHKLTGKLRRKTTGSSTKARWRAWGRRGNIALTSNWNIGPLWRLWRSKLWQFYFITSNRCICARLFGRWCNAMRR